MTEPVLHTVAIDDEPISLRIMEGMAARLPFLRLTRSFTNGVEAREWLISTGGIDLLLVDIKMPDLSGIDLLSSLPEPPMAIFTTGYTEHAIRSFELNAVDYLLKPFSFERFSQACGKALELHQLRKKAGQVEMTDGVIYLRSGSSVERLQLTELQYAQSAGNYVQLVFASGKSLFRLQMNQLEKLLPAVQFVRVHRSCVVNRRFIRRYDRSTVVLLDGTELPVSETYWSGLNAG